MAWWHARVPSRHLAILKTRGDATASFEGYFVRTLNFWLDLFSGRYTKGIKLVSQDSHNEFSSALCRCRRH